MNRTDVILGGAAVLIILLLTWAMVAAVNEWDEFRIKHHCKIVSEESGSTGLGISGSGNAVIITTPGKTGWLCDDGITYYR